MNRFRGVESISLCILADRYNKQGCRTDPPGWKSIPGLLKKVFKNGLWLKYERKNWFVTKDTFSEGLTGIFSFFGLKVPKHENLSFEFFVIQYVIQKKEKSFLFIFSRYTLYRNFLSDQTKTFNCLQIVSENDFQMFFS